METTTANSEILKEPDLFDRIDAELDKTIENEKRARRAILLSLFSIFREGKPIHTLVNSASSAGKSYICGQAIKLFPESRVEYRTKITAQAFTYWHNSKFEPSWTWDGKICYLEDASSDIVSSPTFKVMASEGSISTVVKDQKAIDIKIEGKPAILLTTATGTRSVEVSNRFNYISLDESKLQTERITRFQAKLSAHPELRVPYSQEILKGIECLDQVKVSIPYAETLPNYFPPDEPRTRRDFPRFLALIESSTALHQQQREKKEGYLIADETDYRLAKDAMAVIGDGGMGVSHQLRKALDCCKRLVEKSNTLSEKRFTAKEVWASNPIVSERQWYDYLQALAERSMLNVQLEKKGDSDKKVTTYGLASGLDALRLPDFDKLQSDNYD